MKSRRSFIKLTAVGSAALFTSTNASCNSDIDKTSIIPQKAENNSESSAIRPRVISTWNHGKEANHAAWKTLVNGGKALDAVENGVKVTEADPNNSSVGLGGLPDRDGKVTLDACIMDHESNCGAVAYLEHILHPISVARKIMESTPHIMLVGKGALDFALSQGFEKVDLLTDPSKKAWEEWKKNSKYQPKINSENHDTIGMLAIDEEGNLAGACTTSGMAYKMSGRVGDSPIIGSGLFIDNEVGAACATGVGEAVMRVSGSAMVVEQMRMGKSPQQACEEVVLRIIKKHKNLENMQVGFIALDKEGNYGCYSVYAGFNMALKDTESDEMIDAHYKMEW